MIEKGITEKDIECCYEAAQSRSADSAEIPGMMTDEVEIRIENNPLIVYEAVLAITRAALIDAVATEMAVSVSDNERKLECIADAVRIADGRTTIKNDMLRYIKKKLDAIPEEWWSVNSMADQYGHWLDKFGLGTRFVAQHDYDGFVDVYHKQDMTVRRSPEIMESHGYSTYELEGTIQRFHLKNDNYVFTDEITRKAHQTVAMLMLERWEHQEILVEISTELYRPDYAPTLADNEGRNDEVVIPFEELEEILREAAPEGSDADHVYKKIQEAADMRVSRQPDEVFLISDAGIVMVKASSDSYAAISWVWSDNTIDVIVIRKLLKSASAIGLCRIWLDPFSVAASEPRRSIDISMMASVYSAASRKVIVLFGKGDLRLYNNIRKVSKRAEILTIRNSKWMSRIWTYQETVLPKEVYGLLGERLWRVCDGDSLHEGKSLAIRMRKIAEHSMTTLEARYNSRTRSATMTADYLIGVSALVNDMEVGPAGIKLQLRDVTYPVGYLQQIAEGYGAESACWLPRGRIELASDPFNDKRYFRIRDGHTVELENALVMDLRKHFDLFTHEANSAPTHTQEDISKYAHAASYVVIHSPGRFNSWVYFTQQRLDGVHHVIGSGLVATKRLSVDVVETVLLDGYDLLALMKKIREK